jgi:hypothetical protein
MIWGKASLLENNTYKFLCFLFSISLQCPGFWRWGKSRIYYVQNKGNLGSLVSASIKEALILIWPILFIEVASEIFILKKDSTAKKVENNIHILNV